MVVDGIPWSSDHHFHLGIVSFYKRFLQIVLAEVQTAATPIKLLLCLVATFPIFVICPLSPVLRTDGMYS